MAQWTIIERRGGTAAKWARGIGSHGRITITREIRRNRSGGMGGIRFVVRGIDSAEYAALTMDGAKSHVQFRIDEWNRKDLRIIRD